jgi:hypothetical protein
MEFDENNFQWDNNLGISFESGEEKVQTAVQDISDDIGTSISNLSEQINDINERLDIESMVRARVAETKDSINDIANIIMPLLYNLRQGEDTDVINWPAEKRIPVISERIEQIKLIISRFD